MIKKMEESMMSELECLIMEIGTICGLVWFVYSFIKTVAYEAEIKRMIQRNCDKMDKIRREELRRRQESFSDKNHQNF